MKPRFEFDQLWCLPSWALTNAFTAFFPRTHPWCGKWFPLARWANMERPFLAPVVDVMVWCQLFWIALFALVGRA